MIPGCCTLAKVLESGFGGWFCRQLASMAVTNGVGGEGVTGANYSFRITVVLRFIAFASVHCRQCMSLESTGRTLPPAVSAELLSHGDAG